MKKTICWNGCDVSGEMSDFLRCCGEMGYPVKESSGKGSLIFKKCRGVDRLHVSRQGTTWVIEASNAGLARRGVACVLAGVECDDKLPFDSFGIMLDCSRNKVFELDFLKRYFLQYAMFGCNSVLLYCEDTYVIPSEPFWGYMRGGYTMSELKELDAWCSRIGIELSGCIQTLGHLEHPLQWAFAYGKMKESERILLPGSDESYALIRKMLEFWSEALKSRVIHLGMDEAHDLGRGTSFDKRPGVKPITLFNEHLAKVNAMCGEFGYKSPVIWSDMYFRLTSKTHDYYDTEGNLPKSVVSQIPPNVRLAYWDYYHKERGFYEKYIDIHRATGRDTMLFSGFWTWAHFWYNHAYTEVTARPGIEACLKSKLRQLYFTMWGDDGAYCCYRTALAGFCHCAEIACQSKDPDRAAALYQAVTGEDYKLTLALSEISEPLGKSMVFGDPEILILDDPLYAINWRGMKALDSKVPKTLQARIEKLLKQIPDSLCREANDYSLMRAMLHVLRLKYTVREKLEKAYQADDRKAVKKLLPYVIKWIEEMEAFQQIFRDNWLGYARPFGLETHQIRHAGQLERVCELYRRLSEYSCGLLETIPELDASCGPAATGYQLRLNKFVNSGSALK